MTVTVEHGHDARMPCSSSDLVHTGSCRDPERNRGVTQVMDAKARKSGALDGGDP
jgi:hypothetical protein